MSHGLSSGGGLASAAITVGASPFVFANPLLRDITVIVSAGTVTAIEISRNGGGSWILGGLIAGQYALSPADQIRVTYAAPPTMTMLPT